MLENKQIEHYLETIVIAMNMPEISRFLSETKDQVRVNNFRILLLIEFDFKCV